MWTRAIDLQSGPAAQQSACEEQASSPDVANALAWCGFAFLNHLRRIRPTTVGVGLGCLILLGQVKNWAAEKPSASDAVAVGVHSGSGVLTVPASTAYSIPNPHGIRISGRDGVTRWGSKTDRLVWYGLIRTPGEVEASVEWISKKGKSARFRMQVGGVTRESPAAPAALGTNLVRVPLGTFSLTQTGYQRFELEWLPMEAERDFPVELKNLVLKGSAIERAHFNLKPRRNAASVHWGYPVDAGTRVMAFYAEAQAEEDPILTYYMACGWHRGYFGMQVNSATERRIIFSVWDSGGEAVDRNKVDATHRVTLLAKGEGVFTGDFGNEGTGGHSHWKYPWKTHTVQRFLVTCQPTNETFSIYSGYYWHPEKAVWTLISSWKAPQEGGYMKGLYSFSENFGGENGHLLRKARFGQQWVASPEGKWTELTRARFTHDITGKEDRLDRWGGVEQGSFFLSHGGFVDGYTPSGTVMTRPASGTIPEALAAAIRDLPELRGTTRP